MGEVTKDGNTPATEIAFDRLIELILADEPEYPNDTVLLPADMPGFDKGVSRARAKEAPILIIYPDGRERFIPASASLTANANPSPSAPS